MAMALRILFLICAAALLTSPSLLILAFTLASYKSSPEWHGVIATTLRSTAFNTLFLSTCVGLFATALGFIFAKIFETYRFPLKKFLSFSILSLLVFPPFVFSGMIERAYFFNSMNPAVKLVAVHSIAALPMSFLILRAALQRIPRAYAEAASTLGQNGIQRVLHLHLGLLSLPLFASFLVAAAALATDIESAERVGVKTFSLSINEIWMGSQRNDVAAWLATIIIISTAIVIVPIKSFLLQRTGSNLSQLESLKLNTYGPSNFGPKTITTLFLLFIGTFVASPLLVTITWAFEKVEKVRLWSLLSDFQNALSASLTTVALSFTIGFLLIFFLFSNRGSKLLSATLWISLLNHFLPATVLALSFFVATGTNSIFSSYTNWARESFLGISVATTFRFLPLLLFPLIDSLFRTSPSIPECSRTLALSHWATVQKIIIPISKPAIYAGLSLIFVESMKDVTLTQALAPFGHSTLAMRISSYSQLHMDKEAAVWSLVLIILLIYPLIKIQNYIDAEGN